MTRETWVRRNGVMMLKQDAPPRESTRVNGVISDSMDALVHPCTGKLMDSKSAFRAVTKAKGGVEVGNEKLTDRRDHSIYESQVMREDIGRAIDQLSNR